MISGKDGVTVVRIAQAALESIKTRKVVEMAGYEG